MGETFTVVVIGAIALFTLIGVVSWLSGNSLYDQIGEGGLSGGMGDGGNHGGPATIQSSLDSPAARAEQELEARQMLQARSDRLVRGGGEPLDIDAELAKLYDAHGPPGDRSGKRDPVLAEEVRQLVIARNERRARRGEEPLDVEAEVQRTLAELDP